MENRQARMVEAFLAISKAMRKEGAVSKASQVFDLLERRNNKLVLSSSIAATITAIPSCFLNPNSFADPNGLANRILLGFAIAMINGFRFEFSQSAGRFWRERRFLLRNRHHKRFAIRISPRRSPVLAQAPSEKSVNAMINGFPFEFPQTPRESRVLARFPLFLGEIARINGF